MRQLTVKSRLTIWLTLLMALLAGLLLAFTLSISSAVATRSATEQLSQAVRDELPMISLTEGRLTLADGFLFHRSGVSILIYSSSEALLAGQVPVAFTAAEAFQNGLTRTVSCGQDRYLVLDLWLASGWEDGVWVRGLLEAPDQQQLAGSLLRVALVVLPCFLLLAALGSWWIVRRSFRPLDRITAAAAAINEAKDLSGRIALPPGRDEFSTLAATFDQMFERLERSFEAEKQFTADASHELRTPVSIIQGACEYGLQYDETEEERRETLTMIRRQALRMSELISQLLRMTRLDQGTELAQLQQVDLGELVRSLCQEQGYDVQGLCLELEEGITVQADPALLSRLIENLVENAFKYGRPGGHVWIASAQDAQEIRLSVRDDGIGIPAEEQEKVWQRFYQVEPSRGEGSGAGLGLALVRQIAQVHGGRMTLESVPGVGSSFTLHLPLSVT